MEDVDCECEICKSGPPQCDDCKIELKKGKKSVTEDGIELTEFQCPKCKEKKLDFKIPKELYKQMQEPRSIEEN